MTTTLRLMLPRPHAAQRQVLNEARRYNVLTAGRRTGKTTLGINLASEAMLSGLPVSWFAATNKIQAEAWRDLVKVLKPITRQVSQQEHRIELITAGTLEMWSLEGAGAGRSRKYARIIVDEGALVRDLETDWNEAIRPTLTDYAGDAWFLGTPKGHDYFWTLWMRGQDQNATEWASWQMPTSTNPYIDPAEIEAARLDMPDVAFRQEYLADFIADGAGVFRNVRECATATRQDAPTKDHEYVIGVDWAKHQDWTVLTVIDITAGAMAYRDRFNRIDYTTQVGRLRALYERFRPIQVIPERNSIGEPLIETLRGLGMRVRPFTTTNASKQGAVDALALAFERRDIAILNEPDLIAELLAFQTERLPSGLLRYSAPPGMHDDSVISLALAWQGARRGALIVATA